MNLSRHIAVLWRFKGIVLGGVVLGLILAFLAAYSVTLSGGLGVERRGTETWSSESSILVTQPGFPWGRVTLPTPDPTNNGITSEPTGSDSRSGNEQQFADPGRFSNLALLYSVLSYSDQVRNRLPSHPQRDQLEALPLDATGNGTNFLPIIKFTTKDKTPEAALQLNRDMVAGIRGLLRSQQDRNNIPQSDRVQLSVVNAPSAPVLLSAPSKAPSVLAFLLCMIAAAALAHLLEGMRPSPAAMGPHGSGGRRDGDPPVLAFHALAADDDLREAGVGEGSDGPARRAG